MGRDLERDLALVEETRKIGFIIGEYQSESWEGWPEALKRAIAAEERVKELEDGIRSHRANMLDCCDVEEYYDAELYKLLDK